MLPELFFGYFATAIIVLSVLVITRRNPVHSVMWMLLLFFHIASLYLFLNAEFMAAIQVIVYAGAILVLFLFVVLLLNLREEIQTNRFVSSWPAAFAIAVALLFSTISALKSFVPGPTGEYSVKMIREYTHTKVIGQVLYTDFIFPFEIASLILLVAIIGAIVLAKKRMRS